MEFLVMLVILIITVVAVTSILKAIDKQHENTKTKVKYKRIPINPHVRRTVYKRDGYRCVFCGSPDDLQIDHKIPVSRGGTNDIRNLQTLCRYCNVNKSNKMPYEIRNKRVEERNGVRIPREIIGELKRLN